MTEGTGDGTTLRLALGMRGGVSLAVWIGGAASELDALRARAAHPPGVLRRPAGPRRLHRCADRRDVRGQRRRAERRAGRVGDDRATPGGGDAHHLDACRRPARTVGERRRVRPRPPLPARRGVLRPGGAQRGAPVDGAAAGRPATAARPPVGGVPQRHRAPRAARPDRGRRLQPGRGAALRRPVPLPPPRADPGHQRSRGRHARRRRRRPPGPRGPHHCIVPDRVRADGVRRRRAARGAAAPGPLARAGVVARRRHRRQHPRGAGDRRHPRRAGDRHHRSLVDLPPTEPRRAHRQRRRRRSARSPVTARRGRWPVRRVHVGDDPRRRRDPAPAQPRRHGGRRGVAGGGGRAGPRARRSHTRRDDVGHARRHPGVHPAAGPAARTAMAADRHGHGPVTARRGHLVAARRPAHRAGGGDHGAALQRAAVRPRSCAPRRCSPSGPGRCRVPCRRRRSRRAARRCTATS